MGGGFGGLGCHGVHPRMKQFPPGRWKCRVILLSNSCYDSFQTCKRAALTRRTLTVGRVPLTQDVPGVLTEVWPPEKGSVRCPTANRYEGRGVHEVGRNDQFPQKYLP
jgi:hypothetical protein